MKKKLALVFFLGFLSNIVWENLHANLYVHYQGGEITQLILLRAALFDAAFITLLGVLFLAVPFFRRRLWLALVLGVVFAIGLELFALATGRWAYNDLMPVIPVLGTGATPTVQLGVLAYAIFHLIRLRTFQHLHLF